MHKNNKHILCLCCIADNFDNLDILYFDGALGNAMDVTEYTLCAHIPAIAQGQHLHDINCTELVKTQHIALQTTGLSQPLEICEIKVFATQCKTFFQGQYLIGQIQNSEFFYLLK